MLHCTQTGSVNIHPRFVLQFVSLSVCQLKIWYGESNCRIRMQNAARQFPLFYLSCTVHILEIHLKVNLKNQIVNMLYQLHYYYIIITLRLFEENSFKNLKNLFK